jgi:metal-sulfur cluster biosynthetic enzyme
MSVLETVGDMPASPEAVRRRNEAMAALDAIYDPCSISIGCPIGLVGMGIIDRLEVDGAAVTVSVLPTFPDCMFRTVFEEKIEKGLTALAWCSEVSVRFCPADQAWDETRMSEEALGSLGRRARSPTHVAEVAR